MRARTVLLTALLALAALLRAPAPAAAEPVDLELVLLNDASGSIDEAEIRFEREGWAAALADPAVLAAVGGGFHQKVAVAYVEWGRADSQDVVVPWTVIDGPGAAAAFAAALRAAPRRAFGMNAIGSALDAAQRLIEDGTHEGARKVIDLAADSAWSVGGVPVALARERAVGAGIVINGLAVACREADCSGRPAGDDLEATFAERLIGGPGSFVMTAAERARFTEAARTKLILEIAGLSRRVAGL